MKLKLLLVASAMVLASNGSQSQIIRGYGLKIGAASATVKWNYSDYTHFITSRRWGFDVGVFVEGLDLPFLSVLTECHYIQRGFSAVITSDVQRPLERSVSPRIDYLSIPILAKVRFDIGIFTTSFFAGPRFDFLINHTNDGPFTQVLDELKKNDTGMSMGIGMEVPVQFASRLLAEFRYSPSFNRQFDNGYLKVENQSIELLVGAEW